MGRFKSKYGVVQNDWRMVNIGGEGVFLFSKYNRLCTSSFIYHEEYLVRGGHLQEMLLMMKI